MTLSEEFSDYPADDAEAAKLYRDELYQMDPEAWRRQMHELIKEQAKQ